MLRFQCHVFLNKYFVSQVDISRGEVGVQISNIESTFKHAALYMAHDMSLDGRWLPFYIYVLIVYNQ